MILWSIVVGTRGGINRAKILNLIAATPMNANKIATVLNLDHKTVAHHVKILSKNELVIKAEKEYVAVVSIAGIPESSAVQQKTYEVTITNLTPGQPLTPPLLVTHAKDAGFFTVGKMASDELQQLAENGNAASLVEMLQEKKGVVDIVQGETPLVPANDPGEKVFLTQKHLRFQLQATRDIFRMPAC